MARGKQIKGKIDKSISECLTIFLKSCVIKNLSEKTIKTYRNECNYFMKWYGEENGISKITLETIEDYIVFIKETGISQTYAATRIRQLRAFLYFCMEREYMPSFKITILKADEVEFAIEGAKTKENEKSEQLLMCYHVYLDSIERELKGFINDIDSTIVKCAE